MEGGMEMPSGKRKKPSRFVSPLSSVQKEATSCTALVRVCMKLKFFVNIVQAISKWQVNLV